MDGPLFLRDPFIMNHSIRDNNPEGVRVTGVRPKVGERSQRKEGVGGVRTVTGVPQITQTKNQFVGQVPFPHSSIQSKVPETYNHLEKVQGHT